MRAAADTTSQVDHVQKRVILGDLNARMGYFTGDSVMNARGQALLDWFTSQGYVSCQDQFGVPTFVSYNGTAGSIVDQIWTMVGTEMHSFTGVISEDDIGGSDHRLVYTEMHVVDGTNSIEEENKTRAKSW